MPYPCEVISEVIYNSIYLPDGDIDGMAGIWLVTISWIEP